MKHNILLYSLVGFLFAGLMFSCTEEYKYTEVIEEPDRLFRPPLLETNIDGNEVAFKWIPIRGASYLLELSKDSLAFQNEVQKFEISGHNDFLVENLWSETRYSARIKAVSTNPGIKDSGFQEVTFITGVENIFFDIPSSSMTENTILLSWDKIKEVSKIDVYDGDVLVKTVNLSVEDKTSGAKLIEGLTSKKEYTFNIYLGEMLRGTIKAKTL